MSNDIRVLMIIPSPKDGTSLYRGVMPMAETQKHGVRLVFSESVDWTTMAMTDVVFMQRPYQEKHVAVAELARLNRRPVWVDYDDDLFSVPSDNPAARVYNQPAIKKNMLKILGLADVVTVSTKALGETLRVELAAAGVTTIPVFRVVPNAINTRMWSSTMRSAAMNLERQKLIVWRGSDTHVKDVMRWVPDILEAAHRHPDHVWLFIGMNPWMLESHMPEGRLRHHQAIDPIEFMDVLQELRPSVLHVPLDDSRFNRSKSNIAWIEGAWAGAATVAPDWPEWKRPGVTTYNGQPGSLAAAIDGVIGMSAELQQSLSDNSWEFITQNLTLEHVNRARLNILRELAK